MELPLLPNPLPASYVPCPCCKGTGRLPLTESDAWMRKYTSLSYYDRATDTKECTNCGGQTMSLRALGYTTKDPNTGLGCLHEYTGRSVGRCLHEYTCKICGSSYQIDSGD